MATLAHIRKAFRWSATAQRYRRRNGQFVPQAELTAALRQYALAAGRSLRTLTGRLTAGGLTLAEWQVEMADRVKSVHLAMTLAAAGGADRMTAADYGRLGNRLKFHFGRLQDFALAIESGRISDAQALARADLYGAAGSLTYENARLDFARSGFSEGRRVLAASGEHCPGCLTQAARGWHPIDDVKPLGQEQCKVRCACRLEYR